MNTKFFHSFPSNDASSGNRLTRCTRKVEMGHKTKTLNIIVKTLIDSSDYANYIWT